MAAAADVTDALNVFMKREARRRAAAAADDDEGAEDATPASALGQTLQGGGEADASGADGRAGACFGMQDGAAAAAAMRDAAALGEAVVRARAGGVLADADAALVAAALGALGARVAAGQGAALGPDTRVRPAPMSGKLAEREWCCWPYGIDVCVCKGLQHHCLTVLANADG